MFRAARAERVPLRQFYRTPQENRAEPTLPQQRATEPVLRLAAHAGMTAADTAPDRPDERFELAPVRRTYERLDAGEESGPVPPAGLVKVYEYEKGQYVVVDEQEVRSLAPRTSTEMQIVEFVHFDEIDPVYLETSYYLAPEENGEKAYTLLYNAMRETGHAAIGHLAMHRRDHVVIVRTGKTGLLAHTMYYPEEVRSIQEFRTSTNSAAPKELDLAKSLIQALATSFDPSKFKNNFQERLRELIESRVGDRQITTVASPQPAKVVDIMEALKRSLAQVAPSTEPAVAVKKAVRGERGSRKERRAN
jgi:DNA end-binding protein Ku